MINTGIINATLGIIENAERITVDSFREGGIETEPTFTDRFLGSMEMGLDYRGVVANGYRIRARTLRDRGPNAPENEFGADFVSIFDVDVSGYKLSKGFLAQAKFSEKEGVRIVNKENYRHPMVQVRIGNSRLKHQCENMLRISQASFIFVYSRRGIYVVPATTIMSVENDRTWQEVYSKRLRYFYGEHLMCFVGDLSLDAFDDETLRRRRAESEAKAALLIQVRDS